MWIFVLPAEAGYADAEDGLPTYADRETFLWTNAVRIDPAGFDGEYPCDFDSFSSSEKTTKEPLLFHPGLAAAASYHSHDMEAQDYFDHDSLDGTPWNERVGEYFQGNALGENIAWGYSVPYSAVIGGWMCSDGHRANIMSANFNVLGTGVAGTYYTQDFGGDNTPDRGMAIGLHQPEDPGNDVTLVVDWDGPSAPDEIYAVLAGVRHDLTLLFGSDDRGLYSSVVPVIEDCGAYYFVAVLGSVEERWPEDGSYGFGDCDWSDADADWLDSQIPLEGDEPVGDDDDDDDEPVGDDDDDDDDDVPEGDDDDDDEIDEDDEIKPPPTTTCSHSASPRTGLALLLLALMRRIRARV